MDGSNAHVTLPVPPATLHPGDPSSSLPYLLPFAHETHPFPLAGGTLCSLAQALDFRPLSFPPFLHIPTPRAILRSPAVLSTPSASDDSQTDIPPISMFTYPRAHLIFL